MIKNIFKRVLKEAEKTDESTKNIRVNYDKLENGNISITLGVNYKRIVIRNKDILLLKPGEIICLKYFEKFNKPQVTDIIECKTNLTSWIECYKITYVYLWSSDWILSNEELIKKTNYITIPFNDVFVNKLNSKYKLIETLEELNEYKSSTLSCDDWCRLKLINKMKELGLGDGFINSFVDLIGNDLDKYHQMIDLANECNDRSTLMYMYTYKFGGSNEKKRQSIERIN